MKRAGRLVLQVLFFLTVAANAFGESPGQGEAAPGFELPDQHGNIHSLEDYRDRWVALYFYPADDTPDCTAQACKFRDDIFKYRRMGTEIIGVSLDDTASHKRFARKYDLPFPLLADSDGRTAAAYGVLSRRFGTTFAKRHTFLIDPRGRIARHYADVDPATHSSVLLDDLELLTGIAEEGRTE